MIIKKFEETEILNTPHGLDVRNMYDKDSAMVTVITLKPGESLKQHITPVDVAFYVLEGTGIVEVGEERLEVVKDTLIESPRDIMHCWYNTGNDIVRFMVIKAPRPAA